MVFRVPSGASRGIVNQAPRNYGRATKYMSVQKQVDATVSRANAQYTEALAVDGVAFQYWHRCTEGKYCTCQHPSAESLIQNENAGDSISLTDNNTSADANTLPDSNGSVISFRVRGNRQRRESINTVDLNNILGVTVGDNKDGPVTKEYNEDTDEDAALLKSADDDAFLRMGSDAGILFGGEKTQCGICFGTGYVNGYSLFLGKREIFDASGTYPYTMKKFYLNAKNAPYSFEAPVDNTAYVEWLYELPMYFVNCASFVARDNTKSIKNVSILFKIDGTNNAFAPLTLAFLNSRAGQKTVLRLRLGPTVNGLEGLFVFTHLEIVFQYNNWPYMQMAALGETTNFGVFNSLITTSLTLPPSLPASSKEDVVYDFKYNNLWKLTTVTDAQTSKLQVMGWNADARIIQDFEQLSLLRLTNARNFELAFGSLNSTQGLALASADQFVGGAEMPVLPPFEGI